MSVDRTPVALRLEVRQGLEAAREEWQRLAVGLDNPFASWEWAETWWRHRGRDRPLRISAAFDADRLVAILPLFEAEEGEHPTWRLIGCREADRLGPISATADRVAATSALADALGSGPVSLVADDLPAGSGAVLGGQVVRRTPSPVLPRPPGGYEQLRHQLSRNHRWQLQRRERRLTEAHHVLVREADERTLDRDMDTLIGLHRARWGDRSAVYRGAGEALQREWAEVSLRRGWLRLRILEVDGRPVAANHALRVGDAEWYYQAGRDPAWDHASVGMVLLNACIRLAFDDGACSYRWLRGAEPYKLRWPNRDEIVETVLVRRP